MKVFSHRRRRGNISCLMTALVASMTAVTQAAPVTASVTTSAPTGGRNVLIFVVDGMRSGSVTPAVAPTLYAIKTQGVFFSNSHSLFPTFTTPNASAISTGHLLGDTGDFSNTVYTPFPIFNTGNFGNAPGTTTPFLESNQVLGDIDDHFPGTPGTDDAGGNYLTEESLLAYARLHGYSTAAVGKIGPVAIMDVTQVNPDPVTHKFPAGGPTTIIIDDATGNPATGVPLNADITAALNASGITSGANGNPLVAAPRQQPSGNNTTPGTLNANFNQQNYFADAAAKAVVPLFATRGKPFAMVFWSRDPDGTQHNQGDSLNSLTPGINGPTSLAAISNADHDLAEIIAALKAKGLYANTDIYVTADHGFSTISHHEVDASGTVTDSYAATQSYVNAAGVHDVNTDFTPVGFLAIDLAHDLGLPLYDPDIQITINGVKAYAPVDPTQHATATREQHPTAGDGLIGGTGTIPVPPAGTSFAITDASVVVAANGGSDLLYIPNGTTAQRAALAAQVVNFLSQKDYVSGIFTDDALGPIPGALPLSAIGLKGSATLPTPAIAVNFRSFSVDPKNPIMTGVTFCDSSLQEGQGMHGSFNRADTFNFMAAIGPDFKAGFVDRDPVSNADVQVTLADVLGFDIPSVGSLIGRSAVEALVGGPQSIPFGVGALRSQPAANGQRTVLRYQAVGPNGYFDAAGFEGRTVGL